MAYPPPLAPCLAPHLAWPLTCPALPRPALPRPARSLTSIAEQQHSVRTTCMDGVPVKTCDEMFHDLLESGVTEEELYAAGGWVGGGRGAAHRAVLPVVVPPPRRVCEQFGWRFDVGVGVGQ